MLSDQARDPTFARDRLTAALKERGGGQALKRRERKALLAR